MLEKCKEWRSLPLKYFKAIYLLEHNSLSMLPVLKTKKVFLKTQAMLEKKEQKSNLWYTKGFLTWTQTCINKAIVLGQY